MIPLWKGKNPIYFGVITVIPFDNLYRRAYFVMHTFFVIIGGDFVRGAFVLDPVFSKFELLTNQKCSRL